MKIMPYKRPFTLVPIFGDKEDITHVMSIIRPYQDDVLLFIDKEPDATIMNEIKKKIFIVKLFTHNKSKSFHSFYLDPLCNGVLLLNKYYDNNLPLLNHYVLSSEYNANAVMLVRINTEEQQYNDMLRMLIVRGVKKANRTGIDSLSLFGITSRFSLRHHRLPLLTTKKMFWKAIVEELIWFIRGDTSSKILSDKGVKIWDANGTKEFLESRGITGREEGDLGPIYGFQWRHFGAQYVNSRTDYSGQGIDQLQEILTTLKTDPNSRRMVLTAWNPLVLNEMALPPCHVMAIFNVLNNELNCMVIQRSADVGLGVPFNIASYSLLTYIMSHLSGIAPGELVYVTADTHIYENHLNELIKQYDRFPKPFPCLNIMRKRKEMTFDNLHISDFMLSDYESFEAIHLPMAV